MATLLLFLLLAFIFVFCANAQPGFVSIDCGGTDKFTDDLGVEWDSDAQFMYGQTANISIPGENRKQYLTLRYFPVDERKYCYTFNVTSRYRYLVRGSFLYGNFDNSNIYPKFEISLGATYWATVVISDANTMEVRELILWASSPTISVCLSNATTGQPFISTLELRRFNGSMYYTDFETQFFLSVSARINFGALSEDPVRYPDDPFDRIWQSDTLKKENYLVDAAAGTENVSTNLPIDVNHDERPPQTVMQTAVVGRNGTLTYRLNLEGFPGSGWAFCYFAEIEELSAISTRKFRLFVPGNVEISKPIVDIKENAHGAYRLYEPGFTNITFPFILTFSFLKLSTSSMGPLLNAMEINKYLEINHGSPDANLVVSLTSRFLQSEWAQEGGDPCLPVPWTWVQCNSDPQPRIVSIRLHSNPGPRVLLVFKTATLMVRGVVLKTNKTLGLGFDILSRKNLTGDIPPELTKFTGLTELWLDGNLLTGSIPDFTGCINLKKIHLENNQLTGTIPSSLVDLENLSELWLKNQRSQCWQIKLSYVDTEDLATALPSQKLASFFTEATTETAHSFRLSEIEEATAKFGKRIGAGGYGVVYYGKMTNEKEIAVKVLTSNTYQGKREFSNEDGALSWIKRLEIAEDAAKGFVNYGSHFTFKDYLLLTPSGIEYLHTGCVPPVIHRDLKSSNILLDKNMRAKVADFGLSKISGDGSTHVTSIVRGTVGYLDPEYYVSQHLTDKSDVYSFGVILLELISGREALSNESFGPDCRNIVQWAKSQVETGSVQGMVDPSLRGGFKMQSMWKIIEKALMCVQPYGRLRPSISEVLKDIQEAISIERSPELGDGSSGTFDGSVHSPSHAGSQDLSVFEPVIPYDDPIAFPSAR
ncbi:hypothetical protein ACLOJK_001545 [Asimina triloba]